MVNKSICIFCSWTPNQHVVEAIKHCIRSSFRGSFYNYDAMTKDDQLKWWTDFKVTLLNYHISL